MGNFQSTVWLMVAMGFLSLLGFFLYIDKRHMLNKIAIYVNGKRRTVFYSPKIPEIGEVIPHEHCSKGEPLKVVGIEFPQGEYEVRVNCSAVSASQQEPIGRLACVH